MPVPPYFATVSGCSFLDGTYELEYQIGSKCVWQSGALSKYNPACPPPQGRWSIQLQCNGSGGPALWQLGIECSNNAGPNTGSLIEQQCAPFQLVFSMTFNPVCCDIQGCDPNGITVTITE